MQPAPMPAPAEAEAEAEAEANRVAAKPQVTTNAMTRVECILMLMLGTRKRAVKPRHPPLLLTMMTHKHR